MARLTFEQNFWRQQLDGRAIIIDGQCFHIGDENETGMRGFSGHRFEIELLYDTAAYRKGERIITTNLWHNGKVPNWCGVSDNAKFIH